MAAVYLLPPWDHSGVPRALAAAPGLKWAHSSAAGVDHLALEEFRDRRIVLTNGRGVHTIPAAEGALALLLALLKGLPERRDHQRDRRWAPSRVNELLGSTVGVLGTGSIGQAVARLLRAFGARVYGCSRSGCPRRLFERVWAVSRLASFLSSVDHLVAVLPSTPATRHLLDEKAFRCLRPGGFFVNVGRGSVVEESVLVAGLERGAPAAAALDVFEEEPLPRTSRLWAHPKVLITPHDIDVTPRTGERSRLLFFENLRRFLSGRRLLNRVDLSRGY